MRNLWGDLIVAGALTFSLAAFANSTTNEEFYFPSFRADEIMGFETGITRRGKRRTAFFQLRSKGTNQKAEVKWFIFITLEILKIIKYL